MNKEVDLRQHLSADFRFILPLTETEIQEATCSWNSGSDNLE